VRGASSSGYGVLGESKTGPGVTGLSAGYYGVIGKASFGVWGSGNLVGVSGSSGTGEGVHGSSGNNAGVFGSSGSGPGVHGICHSVKPGVRGESTLNHGVFGLSGNDPGVAGVRGHSNARFGVAGTSNTNTAIIGDGPTIGVLGRSHPKTGRGVIGFSNDGFGLAGVSPSGMAGVFNGNVFVDKDFTVGGNKAAAVKHPDGTRRLTYCVEAPESWLEDFGRAELRDGRASVELDPDFAALIESEDYHVYLTPEGPTRGLYVERREENGFEVREQEEGSSSIAFSYRIVGRRWDVDSNRLEIFEPPPAIETGLLDEPLDTPEQEPVEPAEEGPEPEDPRPLPRKLTPK
jgi:hypothetical protein